MKQSSGSLRQFLKCLFLLQQWVCFGGLLGAVAMFHGTTFAPVQQNGNSVTNYALRA